MEKDIAKFLDYLRFERYRSECTVDAYGRDLTFFASFVDEQDGLETWADVDSDVVRNWMESMMDEGNSVASVNRRLSSLRTFYKYALARNIVDKDPSRGIKGPKKSKPLPQYLREEEMDRLFEPEYWDDSYSSKLLKTVILVFYTTGLRLSELISLKDSDVDLANGQLKILGKRNKERVVPFGEELKVALDSYRSLRSECVEQSSADTFFVNAKGNSLSAAKIQREVKDKLAMVTSIRKRSPHVLRHTFATAMLNNSAGLESVQKILGHESLATTEIYTHTTFEQLRKAYDKAHPREAHSENL